MECYQLPQSPDTMRSSTPELWAKNQTNMVTSPPWNALVRHFVWAMRTVSHVLGLLGWNKEIIYTQVEYILCQAHKDWHVLILDANTQSSIDLLTTHTTPSITIIISVALDSMMFLCSRGGTWTSLNSCNPGFVRALKSVTHLPFHSPLILWLSLHVFHSLDFWGVYSRHRYSPVCIRPADGFVTEQMMPGCKLCLGMNLGTQEGRYMRQWESESFCLLRWHGGKRK